jgi:hypothetical protein
MGFDVHGYDFAGNEVNYFRNTIWDWCPMWLAISGFAQLDQQIAVKGMMNEGVRIEGNPHARLVDGLRRALVIKTPVENVARQAVAMLNANPMHGMGSHYIFSWENVERFLDFCEHNAYFTIC